MLGSYVIDVHTGSLPQDVASGFGSAFEGLVGAQYNPIAYLGYQTVNGLNHAYLAEQTLVTGQDDKSVALVVLNEKPGDVGGKTFSVYSINRLIQAGGPLGGLNIAPTTNIPADAKAVFDKHIAGFLGVNIKPFALLATQVVHGAAYIFAVESSAVVSPDAIAAGCTKSIALVKVYSDFSEVELSEVLWGKTKNAVTAAPTSTSEGALGYAFNWLGQTGHLLIKGSAR